jgi:hypothetical protein
VGSNPSRRAIIAQLYPVPPHEIHFTPYTLQNPRLVWMDFIGGPGDASGISMVSLENQLPGRKILIV